MLIINDTVSIVIPCYNAEKTIQRCIESALNQTYKKVNIIIVNDGSTDRSLELCNQYLKNENVYVINKKNGGVSSARNLGISHANTKYIMFMDSDDFIDPEICRKLIEICKNNNSGMALCGYKRYFKNKTQLMLPNCPSIFNDDDFRKYYGLLYDGTTIVGAPWGKIYDLDIIKKHNIEFSEEISLGEDYLFNQSFFQYNRKISIINHAYYNYICEEGSLSRKYQPNRMFFANKLFLESLNFIQETQCTGAHGNLSNIYIKHFLIFIEGMSNELNKHECLHNINKVLASNEFNLAMQFKKSHDIEFIIYHCIFKIQNAMIIYFFAKLRMKIKLMLRG